VNSADRDVKRVSRETSRQNRCTQVIGDNVVPPSPMSRPERKREASYASNGNPVTVMKAFAGGQLFGARYGVGTPWLLALHGWRRSHSDFAPVLGGAVAGGHPEPLDAIAIDLPGFGSAPPPPEAWGSADYARAVAPILEEMEKPAVVIGHSFGGRVALNLAVLHPGEVGALVLSGVPLGRADGSRRSPSLRFRLGRLLHRVGLVGEDRMERLRYRFGSADYRAASGVMRDVLVRVLAEQYRQQLDALSCPVELVWGDDDSEAPLEVAREVSADLARARLTVCPGAGHLVPLSAPDALRSAAERHRP
jgi:pimeloyl-ACP methyl ester carboxylesterase